MQIVFSTKNTLTSKLALFIFTALFFLACKHNPQEEVTPQKTNTINPTPENDSVSFQTEILPLLVANCAMSGCHDAGSAAEGIVLNNYNNVMRIVRANNTSNSDLYDVITETRINKRMPPPPANPLPPDQIALIAKWINQGAKNTNIPRCDTNVFTYTGAIQGILNTNCNGCHSNITTGGGVLLNSYDNAKNSAISGKLLCSVAQNSTCSPMPKGGAKLDACKITTIKKWIAAGYPNN